jgi:hypothetical protein
MSGFESLLRYQSCDSLRQATIHYDFVLLAEAVRTRWGFRAAARMLEVLSISDPVPRLNAYGILH